jgi:tetratricopeptide (TPR) repeat protein
MIFKIQSLVIMLLLVLLFSGVACGGNLLLGGIDQDKPCVEPCSSAANYDYKKFAVDLDAYYFPMYYNGQANNINEVLNAATGVATDQNGLTNAALKNTNYDTIIAYSGGTSTAVTALASQGVKCHTLILISPMRPSAGTIASAVSAGAEFAGAVPKGSAAITDDIAEYVYKQQIKQLFDNGAVQHIVVIQSPNDQLVFGDLYQAKFGEGEISGIDVIDVDLETTGEQAHKDLFFVHAINHLKRGSNDRVYYVPDGTNSNPPIVQAFQVTPLSLDVGESFAIDYTVSDNDGSDLKQVELWRKDEQSDWQVTRTRFYSEGTDPISDSFTDSPSTPGNYWYGLHVVDNAGNWNDEKNSNTNNPSVSFEPIAVEIENTQYSETSISNDAEFWYNKGNALDAQCKSDEALQAYDKAIELNPDYVSAWYRKGQVLAGLGKSDEALQAYDKAIELDPDDAHAWDEKGSALRYQGKYDEALQAYDEAIRLDPNFILAWHGKGNAFISQGKYDEALQAYDEAIRLDPNYAMVRYAKGEALRYQGKYDEAIQAYDEAIRLNPNAGTFWNKKGVALEALGRSTEADAAFAKAKELGYTG